MTPEIGKPAPDFEAEDSEGRLHRLSDYRSQPVVLEWINYQCPYVRKHYVPGAMQETQRFATANGAIWLTVTSSAPGREGHMSAEIARQTIQEWDMACSAILLDEAGALGKLYDAKTTPHLFVIDSAGVLAYMGAIDSTRSTDSGDIASSRNHVREALSELLRKEPVSVPVSPPYGCSVKYAL